MSEYDPEDLLETTDVPDIVEWLGDIADAVEIGEYEPTPWEVDFIESITERLEKTVEEDSDEEIRPLTGKQLVSLRKIWDKVSE